MAIAYSRGIRDGHGPANISQGKVNTAKSANRPRVAGKYLARDGRPFRLRGVTYGPFAPDRDGLTFPPPDRVSQDLARVRDAGFNAIRTYEVPPGWFLELADVAGVDVWLGLPWLDVPCRRHFAFLESSRVRQEARAFVRRAADLGRRHACIVAYGIGNEIPPDIVRWHGRRRVERFLAELADVVRQADPDALGTHATFPPTEYLDLSFVDFATFNVYLHEPETFRRYLLRLQNLVGDKPLVLGELGMDTLRNGELRQAEFLAGHLREGLLLGLA